MAPPPMTTDLQLSSVVKPSSRPTSPVFPTIIPRPGMSSSDKQGHNDDKALAITTVENSVTCGWYAGAVSQAFICSEPLTCVTNTDSIVACSSKNENIEFNSFCLNVYNGSPRDCAIEGVLCCDSVYPSCMTLVWTASPTRSLVQCAAMESTWLMQDYPFVLGQTTTSIASDTSTSSSSSTKSTFSSDTSKPSTTSGTSSSDITSDKPSSNSPGSSSTRSSDSSTVAPSPGSGLSTSPATTAAPSTTASILPVEQTPSRGLSTGAKAGIGVGAGAGMLIILTLIGLFIFKKYKTRSTTQSDDPPPQTTTPGGAGLQENPNGDLPAEIAPPARVNRSLASGWAVGTSSNDDYDLMEGASEVPVDMRGQGVCAVELAGSPVEMSNLDGISQSQYEEYQSQASQYQRYSQMSRDPWGHVSYQGPTHEHESWSASST